MRQRSEGETWGQEVVGRREIKIRTVCECVCVCVCVCVIMCNECSTCF